MRAYAQFIFVELEFFVPTVFVPGLNLEIVVVVVVVVACHLKSKRARVSNSVARICYL
jgi:hypothetical protein